MPEAIEEPEEQASDWLEEAKRIATIPVPLTPYWDGGTADEALETSILDLRSEAERTTLYARLFALLDSGDPTDADHALQRLQEAFSHEQWEREPERPADCVAPKERLASILLAVERRLPDRPELLEAFVGAFSPDQRNEAECEQIRNWLRSLSNLERVAVSAQTLQAARLFYGACGATWREAGAALLATLDQEDLTLRACAAYQIGRFCRRLTPDEDHLYWRETEPEEDQHKTEGMAPIETYWELIRTKEIERPGVAGAFWHSAPTWTVDGDEWMLSLLERTAQEPYLPWFPCNLDFYAHERFSRSPEAVRRLMAAGRIELAVAAATDDKEPIEGMTPLLIELGRQEEPEVVRLASWHLAYHYNYLHPNGERLGYVQRHIGHPDYDLFSLFSQRTEAESPYAVVLYPKQAEATWTIEQANAVADGVFTPEARGAAQEEEFSAPSQRWFQRGYVHLMLNAESPASRVARVIIGYRSQVYWNPLDSSAPTAN